MVDLQTKKYSEIELPEFMNSYKNNRNNKIILSGSITYKNCRDLLDFITGDDNEYNGIIIWELNML